MYKINKIIHALLSVIIFKGVYDFGNAHTYFFNIL